METSEALDRCKQHLEIMPCACGEQEKALKVSIVGTPETITRKMAYVDEPEPFFLFALQKKSFVGSQRVAVMEYDFRYPGDEKAFDMTRIMAKTRCDICQHQQTMAVMVPVAAIGK